ncbi:FAD-dependent oxidoreductase [Paraburkholderia megapolitana]|uniref:FAD-dependent oxidoreductase n=1 Tax=Paraburkholderia megapolitana TaxID=420953 RepID=UPI0038B835D8
MTHSRTHYDVVVAGAGPIGLLLAANLKRLGLHVAVLEKRATRSTQSKASSMNAYSLAILHALGVVPRFLAAGKPIEELVVYWDERRLARVDYRNLPSRYRYILGLSQPETEALLEEYFVELGGDLRRSTELLGFTETDDAVLLDISPGQSLSCRYLVGCDGGKSTVRSQLGFDFDGLDHGVGFIMFDSQIDWDGDLDQVHYFVKEGSFLIVIPQATGTHRIIIKTRDGEVVEEDEPAKAAAYQTLVDKYGPPGIRVEAVLWESKTQYYNRLAEHYGRGRVFLAGDACHLFSSIGGLGMNTGFQDAFSLAWRLAGVIKGRFNTRVLESYTEERRGITQQLIASTDINTRLITRLDKDERGPLRDWLPTMRNRQRLAHDFPYNFSGLGQRYVSGLIRAGAGLVGKLVPYTEFFVGGTRISSYDLIDSEYFILLSAADAASALAARLSSSPLVKVVAIDRTAVNLGALDVLGLSGQHALLVRPDGIVCVQDVATNETVFASFVDEVSLEAEALRCD